MSWRVYVIEDPLVFPVKASVRIGGDAISA